MVDLKLAEKIVAYLNDLCELDRPAIGALLANRVPCNEKLADHPSCQVITQHGGWHVGLLGLLNGLCGTYESGPKKGYGPIAAKFSDPKETVGDWLELIGFQILQNEPWPSQVEPK
jgi:hypothetical protein